MDEVLNVICKVMQVDVYHLLQWFAYTVIRAASPLHELEPRIKKLMTLLECDAGWQKSFNQANPDELRIAQVILILEQNKHQGYGAVMIDKPFMGESRQTECIDDILERVCEVTMRGIYRRLRMIGAKMGCNNLSDILLTMIDSQLIEDKNEDMTSLLPVLDNKVKGKSMEFGKKTKSTHHRTPDGISNDRRFKFDDINTDSNG